MGPNPRHVTRKEVVQFLSDMNIATREEATQILKKKLNHEDEQVSLDDFYRLFVRGIFRVALIDLLASIEELSDGDQHVPLPLKLDKYRRKLMLNAIVEIRNF